MVDIKRQHLIYFSSTELCYFHPSFGHNPWRSWMVLIAGFLGPSWNVGNLLLGEQAPLFLQRVLQKQRSLAVVYLPGTEPSTALPSSIFPKPERWEDANNNESKWQTSYEQWADPEELHSGLVIHGNGWHRRWDWGELGGPSWHHYSRCWCTACPVFYRPHAWKWQYLSSS